MDNFYPKNGMIVSELKKIVSEWPEYNSYTGEPTEVWITTGDCYTSLCVSATMLNYRDYDGSQWADMLLTSAFHTESKE